MKCGPDRRPALIFITFGCTLSDEDALKAFWGSKGASGWSPCWKCWVTNVLQGESLAEYDATTYLRDIRCGRGEFDLVSDEDRHVEADVLTKCKPLLKPKQFERVEKAFGLNYAPQGVLWDLDLRAIVRPQSGSRYDFAHCFLCSGIVNEEVDLLLRRMHDLRPPITFEVLNAYFNADWLGAQTFNGRLEKQQAKDVFSKQREGHFKNEGKFRPNASQMLYVVPVLAHFMQTVAVVGEKLPAETASLVALSEVWSQTAKAAHASHKPCWADMAVVPRNRHVCRVARQKRSLQRHTADISAVSPNRHVCCVAQQKRLLRVAADMSAACHARDVCRFSKGCMEAMARFGLKVLYHVKSGKRGEAGVAHKLKQSFGKWAQLSDVAYGADDRIPKFHFSQHLWEQVEQDGFIMDCFATERANSSWLKAATPVDHTAKFEKSVSLRVVNLHLGKLCQVRRDCLFEEKPWPTLALDAYVSKSMQWQGCRLFVDDVVVVDDSTTLLVLACARVGVEFAIAASALEKRGQLTRGSCVYETMARRDAQLVFLSGRRLRLPTAWHRKDNSLLVVVD